MNNSRIWHCPLFFHHCVYATLMTHALHHWFPWSPLLIFLWNKFIIYFPNSSVPLIFYWSCFPKSLYLFFSLIHLILSYFLLFCTFFCCLFSCLLFTYYLSYPLLSSISLYPTLSLQCLIHSSCATFLYVILTPHQTSFGFSSNSPSYLSLMPPHPRIQTSYNVWLFLCIHTLVHHLPSFHSLHSLPSFFPKFFFGITHSIPHYYMIQLCNSDISFFLHRHIKWFSICFLYVFFLLNT